MKTKMFLGKPHEFWNALMFVFFIVAMIICEFGMFFSLPIWGLAGFAFAVAFTGIVVCGAIMLLLI